MSGSTEGAELSGSVGAAPQRPVISVVIPAKDAERTIGVQLEALARQEYAGPWEVIVADNGSSDKTREIAEGHRDRLPHLRVVDASARPGAAAARNIGARAARGTLLAFCDADDEVAPGWLGALARALESHAFVAGAMDHDAYAKGHGWFYRSHVTSAPRGLRFLPYALSCNMGVQRTPFLEVGGFPEDLRVSRGAAGEDPAISFLLQLAGYELHFEPAAVVAYRHRTSYRAIWRQYVAYGFAMPVLFKRFRAEGVPPISPLNALREYVQLAIRLPTLVTRDRRLRWLRKAALRWGRLLGSIRERVWYL